MRVRAEGTRHATRSRSALADRSRGPPFRERRPRPGTEERPASPFMSRSDVNVFRHLKKGCRMTPSSRYRAALFRRHCSSCRCGRRRGSGRSRLSASAYSPSPWRRRRGARVWHARSASSLRAPRPAARSVPVRPQGPTPVGDLVRRHSVLFRGGNRKPPLHPLIPWCVWLPRGPAGPRGSHEVFSSGDR